MKNLITVSFIFISSLTHGSFLPESDLRIGQKSFEQDQKLAIDYGTLAIKIVQEFQSIANNQSAQFKLLVDLENDRVNATASRDGTNNQNWNVTIFGGLLRSKYLTKEILATITCHEIGHHIAGAPFKRPSHWVTVEGQADYFATNYCLKKLYKEKILIPNKAEKFPKFIKKKCLNSFKNTEEIFHCNLIAKAGLDVGIFLSQINTGRRGRRGKAPSVDKRDQSVTSSTVTSHPPHQCRFDTFFEGALCSTGYSQEILTSNCPSITNRYYLGERPRCWYSDK